MVNTVEEARVRLPIIDPKAVFLAFTKQLDGGLACRVKARQEQHEMDGTGTITWAEVVRAVQEMQVKCAAGLSKDDKNVNTTAAPSKSASPALPASVVPAPAPTAPAVAAAAYHAPVYAATLAAVTPSAPTISAAMPATAATAVLATESYSSKANPKYTCYICKPLGTPHNHREEVCFINPKSTVFKPEVRAHRLAAAVAHGQVVVD